MTKIRLKVLNWWLRGINNNVGLVELVRYFFAASYGAKAATVIERIFEEDEYFIVSFKKMNRSLYYPKTYDLEMLKRSAVEILFPDNWHYYEVAETKAEMDDTVADCGAAEGLFSLKVEQRCKYVYMIEPLPGYLEALRRTFRDAASVEIIPCAISDTPGGAYISDDGASSSLNESNGRPVRVETIDRLFYEKNIPLNYIKADLEGHDFKAIVGARNTIRECRPKIAITTYHDPGHAKMIRDFITSIEPRYRFKVKGIYQETGSPVMLHAWCDK